MLDLCVYASVCGASAQANVFVRKCGTTRGWRVNHTFANLSACILHNNYILRYLFVNNFIKLAWSLFCHKHTRAHTRQFPLFSRANKMNVMSLNSLYMCVLIFYEIFICCISVCPLFSPRAELYFYARIS